MVLKTPAPSNVEEVGFASGGTRALLPPVMMANFRSPLALNQSLWFVPRDRSLSLLLIVSGALRRSSLLAAVVGWAARG